MWAIGYVVLFVVVQAVPLLYFHTSIHGFNLLQASLAVFCAVNTMISLWEISLFINISTIRAEYLEYKKRLPKFAFPSPMFMFDHVPLGTALTLKFWRQVWSNYSLMDPSYQDQTSFGFFIDIGNGFVTLVPTVLLGLCMTWPLMEARLLGIMSIIFNYQMLYGTVLYFLSYLMNHRYRGAPPVLVAGVVVASNFVWVVFPAIAMYASYQLIMTNSYDVFRS